MLEKMFNSSRAAERALDASWTRSEAISQNIANVDTPGYKRKTVSFEESLNEALESRDRSKKLGLSSQNAASKKSSIDDVEINVSEDNKTLSMRLDGNNVDIDTEMASWAKNTIKYNTLIEGLNANYNRLKTVIKEGR